MLSFMSICFLFLKLAIESMRNQILLKKIIFKKESQATSNERKSKRQTRKPDYLKDYHCNLLETGNITEYEIGKYHPLPSMIAYDKLSTSYRTYSSKLLAEQEPKTYHVASKQKEWIKAMEMR